MGYRPQPKRFRLTFEPEHEFHGLEIVTKSVPIGTLLAILRVAGKGGTGRPGVDDVEAVAGMFDEFGNALIEWTMEHPDTGEPVPASADGLRTLDTDLVRAGRALEEVGELLDVLEFHEVERVLGPEHLGQVERREALVGDVLEVLARHAGQRDDVQRSLLDRVCCAIGLSGR